MLPFIDRVGRRNLLLIGSVTCMVVHFIIAAVMASKGNPVPNVNGNANLTWEIKGSAGMTVIAFSYIFTGIYGLTWVCYIQLCLYPKHRLTFLGSNCMDLCRRGFPSEVSSEGRRLVGRHQLDFQFCSGLLCGTGLPQYSVEDLYYFRGILHCHDFPCILHVS